MLGLGGFWTSHWRGGAIVNALGLQEFLFTRLCAREAHDAPPAGPRRPGSRRGIVFGWLERHSTKAGENKSGIKPLGYLAQ
jgi:hypothetical protein